jgi:hypothetical protein
VLPGIVKNDFQILLIGRRGTGASRSILSRLIKPCGKLFVTFFAASPGIEAALRQRREAPL